eukprot:GFYU01003205.1.p1 GENE.GFYU01003205.1~~GFYU01003205.1.p1  ORF type:complete len:217 (+),score=65.11 GFYU01003205.1:62-712(+)
MGLKNTLLVAYNLVCHLGWGYVLFLMVQNYVNGGSAADVYGKLGFYLQVSQSLAVFEIVFALTGMVRAPVFTTAVQVASRLYVVWLILDLVPETTTSVFVTTLLTAWSVTEVVRYAFYGLNLVGDVPYVITYLRYTLFLVLYPLGVMSEMALTYLAMPFIKERQILTVTLPNWFNYSFDYYLYCGVLLVIYPFGLWMLYSYMLAQRKKVLGKVKSQ